MSAVAVMVLSVALVGLFVLNVKCKFILDLLKL